MCDSFSKHLFTAFIAQYYPEPDMPTPTTDFADRAALIKGTYRLNRMSHTTAEKILRLAQAYRFKMLKDGTLTMAGSDWTFVEVAPFVFRQTNGPRTLIFRSDGQSPATHAFISSMPYLVLERTPASASMLLHLALAGLSLVLFLSFLTGGLVGFLVRRKRGKDAPPQLARVARWVLAGVVGLSLLFLLLFAMGIPGDLMMMGKIPLQGLAPIVFVLMMGAALVASGFTFFVWENGYWRVLGRVHYTVTMLAVWAFI